jgi:hypothetical protein
MFKTISKVIPHQNQKSFARKWVPLLSLTLFVLSPAIAADTPSSWSDKQTSLSVKEYFDLLLSTKFQNLNPAEPISVDFVPNSAKEDALIFIVRPVVTPDLDLTVESSQKSEIINNFRSNVNKQATSQLAFGRRLFEQKSVTERWTGATVERNLAIRFVRADNERKTVAITSNGKTVFEADELKTESAPIKARAGELWVE